MTLKRSAWASPILFGLLLGAAISARASSLAHGFDWYNADFHGSVTITYSWSGHYPGKDDVCLLPQTVNIRAGGTVHLDPPRGFIPSDFIVIKKEYSDGTTAGGLSVDDPPSTSAETRIELPCPEKDNPVWGYYYFGATDYGPVFANVPLAMRGLDEKGIPQVVAAKVDEGGAPVLNFTKTGHCMIPTEVSVMADPATRTVLEEFAPRPSENVCAVLTFRK